ncbi:MAG: RNB domain-containing ribonuclease [SAR324 cluster bacterium]|nr:RNB domain-containing ribonuclease [SAR324 cluster bacterium]
MCLQKNKLSIQPLLGQSFFASLRQTLYQWKGKAFSNGEEGLAFLIDKSAATQKASEAVDLEIIHELIEPGETYELTELIQDFTDDPADPWAGVALFLALKADQLLFHNKNLHFTARSPEEIENLKATALKKAAAEGKKEREADWCSQLHKGSCPEISETEAQEWEAFKKRFFHFLIHWVDSQEKDAFAELLQIKDFSNLETENHARKVLELAGCKLSWGRLQVLRLAVSKDFTSEEEASAKKIVATEAIPTCFEQDRQDLTGQASYTIDSATTKDFDDALSFEILDDGVRLQVHIADVASYITPDQPLFTMASAKISSLYTVKGKYSMLPRLLSEDFLSLKEQVPRACQTFDFTFETNFDGEFKLTKNEIYPSLIKVTNNLSYLEADQKIQEEEDWAKLAQLSEGLTAARVARGALEFDRKEYELDISDPHAVKISESLRQTPANALVQECAILANSAAAGLAHEALVNFYFRNQPPYGVSSDLPEGVKPQLKDLKIQPAKLGLRTEGHSALGLEAYGQVTSPIRRFVDLVGQWLVYAILSNRPSPFSEETLLSWMPMIEETAKDYGRTERALTDHWKIVYLSQNLEATYQALWMRTLRNDNQLVRLVDLDFVVEMHLEEITPELTVKIESINPALNQVRLVKVVEPEQA